MKRKAITDEEMETSYRKCLERERIRQCKWRKTKQGKFESSFVSYDAILDDPDGAVDKFRCAGILGTVISDPDHDKPPIDPGRLPARERNRLKAACNKLRRHEKEHLSRTLQFIAENGTNREESICQMMIDTLKRQLQNLCDATGTSRPRGAWGVQLAQKHTKLRKRPTSGTGKNSAVSSASKRAKRRGKKRGQKRSNLESPEKKFTFS